MNNRWSFTIFLNHKEPTKKIIKIEIKKKIFLDESSKRRECCNDEWRDQIFFTLQLFDSFWEKNISFDEMS